MKIRVVNISTYLCEDEDHATYQNDEQDGCRCGDSDIWDLLSPEEQAARRDPDQYILMVNKNKEIKVWKSVAKFKRRLLAYIPSENGPDTNVDFWVHWDAQKETWKVVVEHEGDVIDFGHHQSHDDALAFALEAVRCLQPNAALSGAECFHQPETRTLQGIAEIVASTIGRRCDNEKIPPRVKAVILLNMLHNSGGQFERNRDGTWQLWQEEEDDINPELISHATDIQHEVAEVLDTAWSDFHSYKIDPDQFLLNVPQRV